MRNAAWLSWLVLLLACSDGASKRAPPEPDQDEATGAQADADEADAETDPARGERANDDEGSPIEAASADAGSATTQAMREDATAAQRDASAPITEGPAGDDARAPVAAGESASADASSTTAPDASTEEPALDAAAPDAGAHDAAVEDAERDASGPICTQCGACEQSIPVTNADHRPEPVVYTDVPPAGGLHAACWTSWGVHTEEVPAGRWVHNQEHGAVVFLYNCPEGCAAEISALEALVPGRPFAIVVPYSAMTARFAVASWGHRIVSECLDIAAFADFYARYANMGRESTVDAPPGGC